MLIYKFYVFLIAMLPVLELRGALPLGLAWGLDSREVLLLALLGNVLPIPFVYHFGEKLLIFLSEKKFFKKISQHILQKAQKKAQKLEEKRSWQVYIALASFVAIPLPGSGIYTALLVASFLKLDFKKSCLATFVGVCVAGLAIFFSFFLLFS